MSLTVQVLYLITSLLFIAGLRSLGNAETARRGIVMAEVGMLLAVIGTLLHHEVITYQWIAIGMFIGATIGTLMSVFIPMTKMPERIALSHAFGGLAVALVGVNEYLKHVFDGFTAFEMGATTLEIFLGALTFTGSLMAFGKLQGLLPGRPITFRGQNALNIAMILLVLGMIVALCVFADGLESSDYVVSVLGKTEGLDGFKYAFDGTQAHTHVQQVALTLLGCFLAVVVLGLVLGVSLVLPIGGADMPVVICLLNSYAGLAASATGFAIDNPVLIICGALDGGSGFILGMMMSKAMNRSFSNVIFGAFGSDGTSAAATGTGPAAIPNEASVEDAAEVLRAATSVIVIPGYGLAVSQAQHAVRDLASELEKNGGTVRYAIHPVAGRMPGHMNVLLAEANIPYDQLFDLDDINDDFKQTDVALVVGANDVVNPAARTNQSSPIYGMPVFHCEQARTVIVLKRTMNPGFAGIENELFVQPNTMMVLGDAKKTITSFTSALKN